MRQVGQDLVEHHRIFDASDDVHGRTNAAGGRMPRAASRRSVFRRILRASLVALAALGWRHLCTMRAVGCENAVEASEVDPGFGHQGDESRNKVHRLEDDVRGAIAVRSFELVAHTAIAQ